MKGGASRLAPRLVGIVAILVIVAALATELIATRNALGEARREVAVLRDWQGAMLAQLGQGRRLVGGAHIGARLDVTDASETLAEIISERDTATEVMRLSSTRAGRQNASSLAAGLGGPNSISRLRGRESSGIAGQDVSAIESDSKAAWGGWK